MGKKVKEYKSGDFIFAKVKGYPAWPARVQKLNGKKYFVYFYGTGETANLPPNMIFDYAENKDKFLTKTVKRRDFNDGVKQIEYDFANNVPLEQVIGVPMEDIADANDTANDSAIDTTMDETMADTTANDTVANNTAGDDANLTQNDAVVEDSDEAGTLVIDEGKAPIKGKKSKADSAKTPAKETPKAKEPKTPRGKGKKEEVKDKEEEKIIDEEVVSRSGRKIRPKRYMDEQTEDNATLPSPAPKRRRGASPTAEKEKTDGAKEKDGGKNDKTFTQFNAVKQFELEMLKEPFKPVDEEKDNILIAYLPTGTYVGIKLFQERPNVFKNEASRLTWDKQAAANAITLKMQLERNQITPQSVQGQLVMDLNLTDEEKATLDKERETEEKKSRVNFLKTEMKLIELDAKIKSCLCLEKADTDLCLKLLDELMSLEVKPLMLLKHPTCLETVKRMRAYVGNTPSWDLTENAALVFSRQAHRIRKKADILYKNLKEHFDTPENLSFWEYFSERVMIFKRVTSNLTASELLEMVHEPIQMSQPNTHTMRAAIEKANTIVPALPEDAEIEGEDKNVKKKGPAGKAKKSPANSSPSKSKRSSRSNKKEEEDIPQDQPSESSKPSEETPEVSEKAAEGNKNGDEGGDKEKNQEENAEEISEESSKENPKEPENISQEPKESVELTDAEKPPEEEQNATDATEKEKEIEATSKESEINEKSKDAEKSTKETKTDKNKESDRSSRDERSSRKDKKSKEDKSERSEKSSKDEDSVKSGKDSDKTGKDSDRSGKDTDKTGKDNDKSGKDSDKSPTKSAKEDKHSKDGEKSGRKSSRDHEKSSKDHEKSSKDHEKSSKDSAKNGKESERSGKEKDEKSDDKSEAKDEKSDDKEKQEGGEPRAKRSRESKKTDSLPPRSPAKRKSKF